MRVAILGLGMAAAPHAASLHDLRDRVTVANAFGPTASRRDTFAARYGFPVTDNPDLAFTDTSVDAVLILTPPNSHLDLVHKAAKAGKHVLLEKPLEITTERAEALVEAAERAGVTLGVVLQHRFRPASQELAALIAQDRLGTLVAASASVLNWRPQSYYDEPGRGTRARDGGGVLLTQAIHSLDLLISLAGSPSEVSAFAATSPIHRMETEDIVAAAVRYASGAMGTIGATTCAYPGVPDAIHLIGTKGTAVLHGGRLSAQFHNGTRQDMGDESAGGAGADPMAFTHHHHRAVLADFVDAVKSGRKPRVSGRDALQVHRLIDALLRSSSTGMPARVDI